MSIVAVFVDDDRALVGVDTEVFGPDGAPASISKMVPMVHMNAVLAYRGTAMFLEMLFGACHRQGGTFDSLADQLPEILGALSVEFAAVAAHLGYRGAQIEAHNLVFVGWSDAQKRMVCWGFDQSTQADGFQRAEYRNWYGAPGIRSRITLPLDRDIAALKLVASAQVQLMHEAAPGEPAGGRLIVAQLTETHMTIGAVCDL